MDPVQFLSSYGNQSRIAALELGQATLARAVYSRWQLRERMVEFWHDHLNVHQPNTRVSRLAHQSYDRDVIRRHTFGRFDEMLIASAKSAAMLNYLDGGENVVGAPNENYAREVMELHTLGVDGPYTEFDIAELARCLTGWSFDPFVDPAAPGAFRFEPSLHDNGSKDILGINFPPGRGVEEGEEILDHLARHPKTIDFVCKKLVRRFVSESAPAGAVHLVKSTWLQTGGDLKAVTRTLFSDTVANRARPWDNRKVKRPIQFAVGLVRALGRETSDSFEELLTRLAGLGQRPFYWAAPNGYPDSSQAWAGDLYGRWSFACDYANNLADGLPLTEPGRRRDPNLGAADRDRREAQRHADRGSHAPRRHGPRADVDRRAAVLRHHGDARRDRHARIGPRLSVRLRSCSTNTPTIPRRRCPGARSSGLPPRLRVPRASHA